MGHACHDALMQCMTSHFSNFLQYILRVKIHDKFCGSIILIRNCLEDVQVIIKRESSFICVFLSSLLKIEKCFVTITDFVMLDTTAYSLAVEGFSTTKDIQMSKFLLRNRRYRNLFSYCICLSGTGCDKR